MIDRGKKFHNTMMNIYPLKEIEAVKDWLLKERATIAVAESVTAGWLQGALSQAGDARRFFQGGLTAYNVGQKCRLLRVEPVHALESNGVSAIVAEEMARSVADVFCAGYGIGITGYAAPVPEKDIQQPFAFYAIFGHGEILRSQRLEAPAGDALSVQLYYVERIITNLKEVLSAPSRSPG